MENQYEFAKRRLLTTAMFLFYVRLSGKIHSLCGGSMSIVLNMWHQ